MSLLFAGNLLWCWVCNDMVVFVQCWHGGLSLWYRHTLSLRFQKGSMIEHGNCTRGYWIAQSTWKCGWALPSLRQQCHQRKKLVQKRKAGSLILTGCWKKQSNKCFDPEVRFLWQDLFGWCSCVSGRRGVVRRAGQNGKPVLLRDILLLFFGCLRDFWESFRKLTNNSTWTERGESYVTWGMAGYRGQLCGPWWCGNSTKEDATEGEAKTAHLFRGWDTCWVQSFVLTIYEPTLLIIVCPHYLQSVA